MVMRDITSSLYRRAGVVNSKLHRDWGRTSSVVGGVTAVIGDRRGCMAGRLLLIGPP